MSSPAAWWSRMPRPYRLNAALYVLASLALVGLLFEVATGTDTSPKQQVATQSPSSTVPPPTTARATIPTTTPSPSSSSTSSTSIDAPVTLPAADSGRDHGDDVCSGRDHHHAAFHRRPAGGDHHRGP